MTLPRGSQSDFDYRVGSSASIMFKLRDLDIPPPDQVIYKPFQSAYVRGDNTRVGDGCISVEWTWDVMDIQWLHTLTGIFFSNIPTTSYARDMYIKTDIRTGDYASAPLAFTVYKCVVWRPQLFGEDGQPIVRSLRAYQTVRFTFTDLVHYEE